MFICGSGSFSHHQDHEDEIGSPCRTPKRSKRNSGFCKIIGKDSSNNKNPYANRGLDKFYALLADLDNKKQKIYTSKGAEDISFVRFVYTNDSDHVKPIVVKVKEKKEEKKLEKKITGLIKKSFKKNSSNLKQAGVVLDDVSDKTTATTVANQSTDIEKLNEKRPKKKRCLRCKESFKLENLRQPYFYFPVIVMFVLMFLVMYGRSFAVLCTSIGWYMVPTITGRSSQSSSSSSSTSNERKPKRKKEHSEGPSSPKSVINGLIEINKAQKQHQ
ncbi:hypothetical protein CASFOL_038198 [Castilleja foliolosa]|uniref:ZCF37 n=1 Tax=Castilleja foliolosa TaxID=1961234 RepID=A0ABD3BKS0_9LAMI